MTIDAPTDHAQGNQPHLALAPLSRSQAALLVHLSLTTATDHGLSLRYEGGAALVPTDGSPHGPVVGLSNLARILAGYDERDWPDLVDEHFTEILQQLRAGPPEPPSDPEHALIQRLVPRGSLPPDWTADRPDFLPGLLSVPSSVDDGIVTMWLEPQDLGLNWSTAEGFGLANLRRQEDQVVYVDQGDFRVAMISGTPYAASRALVLDTVLRESLHLDEPPAFGVLAALPARDTLLLHVIRDLSVIPALGLLMHLASRSYARDPGPLTPDVFLVSPSLTWYQATTADEDHRPLQMSPQLAGLAKLLANAETHSMLLATSLQEE